MIDETIVVGIVTFIFLRWWELRRDSRAANREIYQRLELASVELFRFDGKEQEIVAPLHDDKREIPDETRNPVQYNAYLNYICQIMNLFEMAARFRREHVMPAEVFGSWVTWFYDVCQKKNFKPIWWAVRLNYTCDLRILMDEGVRIADRIERFNENAEEKIDREEGRKEFFDFVAGKYKCSHVKLWMKCQGKGIESSKTCKKCPSLNDIALNSDNPDDDSRPHKPSVTVSLCERPEMAERLAQFFVDNVADTYISHGEIQDGRAHDFGAWPPNILSTMRADFRHALSAKAASKTRSRVYVATKGRNLLGLALLQLRETKGLQYGIVEDLVVQEDCRKTGIGTALLSKVEECAKKENLAFLFLESGVRNATAHSFFDHHGFKTCSKVMVKKIEK